jgi:hypothetical protein
LTKIAYDNLQGNFVIDDFHALEGGLRNRLIQLAKLAADPLAPYRPKLVFIGINGFGATLLEANPEIARRLGRHTVEPGRSEDLRKLAQQGLRLLKAEIDNLEEVILTAKGDYWTAQTILKNACIAANVLKTGQAKVKFSADVHKLVTGMVSTLADQYRPVVMKFCGGLRQRPSNDAYLEFLRGMAPRLHETSFITEVLGSRSPGAKAWQRIRDGRLSDHIAKSDQLSRYFFFSTPDKRFLVEEPGLLFYLQHLDWKKLRKRCGLNERPKHHTYDVAISFAGQNRLLAKQLAKILSENDFVVFIDENHEAEMSGRHYYKTFKRVFGKEAAVILPLVDEAYVDRLWTTFERECFLPRVAKSAVIPIRLDKVECPGLPMSLHGVVMHVPLVDRHRYNIAGDRNMVRSLLTMLDSKI